MTTASIKGFPITGMMRYSIFVPRLYNFCKSLGFTPGKIMPSRAFCSDENQGYPVILLAKHFGSFPFNHGRVGGIVATDRHGPYAEHGQDLVIVQASHVGYDPDQQAFGRYRRVQTEHEDSTPTCGKVYGVLDWYSNEYAFARQNIFVEKTGDRHSVIIDNQLLQPNRDEGLFLRLEQMAAEGPNGQPVAIDSFSTAHGFKLNEVFLDRLGGDAPQDGDRIPIGDALTADLFYFRRNIPHDVEGGSHLENNLLPYMSDIVTSQTPGLMAAEINTQVEFDRTYRSIIKSEDYKGHNLLYIAGLNIDISPQEGNIFPLTKYVPWAAYIQNRNGEYYTLEQDELTARLNEQGTDNPDQIDLEEAIGMMGKATEVQIEI